MDNIIDKFTTQLKNVLTRALCLAVEKQESSIRAEHLLWALGTQKGAIGAELLHRVNVKEEDLQALVAEPLVPAGASGMSSPFLSDDARRVVEKAVLTATSFEHRYIGTEHLLASLIEIGLPSVRAFFDAHEVNIENLHQQTIAVLKSTTKFHDMTQSVTEERESRAVVQADEEKKTPALDYFCRDLTNPKIQANIDPVVGREAEIERVVQILCRRTKNNPLLLGDPGVGKTAIVEGLAKKIVARQVPAPLRDKRILALDLASLVAGTMYRGEFEGRVKQVLEEIQQEENVILFIDEIHTLVGAGAASGSMDAANMLKPALARGEIHCIGATTAAEFKKNLETDAALERRFCPVIVQEPDTEKTRLILKGVCHAYELHHHVTISEEAREAAIVLSTRYLPERHQPDKALDLIDEAAAAVRVRMSADDEWQSMQDLKDELKRLKSEKHQAVLQERFADAIALKEREVQIRTQLSELEQSEHLLHGNPATVTAHDVVEVVSRITGMPLTLVAEEIERLQTLETRLQTRVIGQDDAVRAVTTAVRRAKTGVQDPHRPLASFLFLGPSGVGKTELARAIATEVFQDASALVALDMSEFAEGFSVSKLIGAPAGYVGFREAAKLTDRVKQRPYAVVLFDELEKAHRDVTNLLLQILETGTLTDATGRAVHFKQTIIVMTSNVGAERFTQSGIGFGAAENRENLKLTDDLKRELDERFRPELMNRIDSICLFQPFTPERLEQIAAKMLRELSKRLVQEQVHVSMSPKVAPWLSARADRRLGARDLRRLIQTEVENRIAEVLLQERARPVKIHTTPDRDQLKVEKK